jgi:hypothetical protein
MSTFNSASGGSVGGVTYTDPSGCTQTYSGGSRAWRNNNPGNLKEGPFSRENGSIGKDSGGYAIFPDAETGMDAMKTLLNSTYREKSVGEMVDEYAPAEDGNNTTAYKNFLSNKGFPPETEIADLDSDELSELAGAMAQLEGNKAGTIGEIICPESSSV